MRKVRSNKMLVLPNLTMKPSNVGEKKKKKGTTECDRSTVTYDVGTTQFFRMLLSNVRKKYEYN